MLYPELLKDELLKLNNIQDIINKYNILNDLLALNSIWYYQDLVHVKFKPTENINKRFTLSDLEKSIRYSVQQHILLIALVINGYKFKLIDGEYYSNISITPLKQLGLFV